MASLPRWTFRHAKSLKSIIIPEKITEITESSLEGCISLEEITLIGVKKINSTAFFTCSSLRKVIFSGTVAEWNALEKIKTWNRGCPEITVICTDGTVTVPANKQ